MIELRTTEENFVPRPCPVCGVGATGHGWIYLEHDGDRRYVGEFFTHDNWRQCRFDYTLSGIKPARP